MKATSSKSCWIFQERRSQSHALTSIKSVDIFPYRRLTPLQNSLLAWLSCLPPLRSLGRASEFSSLIIVLLLLLTPASSWHNRRTPPPTQWKLACDSPRLRCIDHVNAGASTRSLGPWQPVRSPSSCPGTDTLADTGHFLPCPPSHLGTPFGTASISFVGLLPATKLELAAIWSGVLCWQVTGLYSLASGLTGARGIICRPGYDANRRRLASVPSGPGDAGVASYLRYEHSTESNQKQPEGDNPQGA